MDRRIALKNIGLSLGYVVAVPTLVSIVQSCKNEKAITWAPDFFTQEEGKVITQLVDLILPKTNTPSASEVQVHSFIDKFANQVMEKEQQDLLKINMGKFIEKAIKEAGKEKAIDLVPEDLEPILASTLKVSKEQIKSHKKAINTYKKTKKDGNTAPLADDVARYAFADHLRQLTIWGYKTSEYVGEEVLAYLPIPGEYVACGDLQELSGGKAWSI